MLGKLSSTTVSPTMLMQKLFPSWVSMRTTASPLVFSLHDTAVALGHPSSSRAYCSAIALTLLIGIAVVSDVLKEVVHIDIVTVCRDAEDWLALKIAEYEHQ